MMQTERVGKVALNWRLRRKAENLEEQDPILHGKTERWNEATERMGKFFTVDMSSQEKKISLRR